MEELRQIFLRYAFLMIMRKRSQTLWRNSRIRWKNIRWILISRLSLGYILWKTVIFPSTKCMTKPILHPKTVREIISRTISFTQKRWARRSSRSSTSSTIWRMRWRTKSLCCICSPNMNFSEIPLQEQKFWCDGSQQMAGWYRRENLSRYLRGTVLSWSWISMSGKRHASCLRDGEMREEKYFRFPSIFRV